MNIDTIALHAGYHGGNGEPHALPIYQSTTYNYDSTDHIGQLFDLTADGHMYSRISNPTVACVLMTPISPGNLHTRPFVLSNGDCIRVEVKTQGMAPTLYLDGQDSYPLTQNCVLHFQKAKESIRFIRIEGRRGMFTTLKEKLYTL